MKKLVLLFASFLVLASSANAKEVASYVPEAPVSTLPAGQSPSAPAELKTVSQSATGDELGKKDIKLTAAQKMALKMMKKPLKKATTDAGISGDLRTAIIVIAIGLILMILGTILWVFWFIGAIVLVIGLILLLLALLG